MPMTLRQVLESLSTTKSSSRVEDQISKAGVQFRSTPDVIDILKQFGASAKLISMIPPPATPPPAPAPAPPRVAGPLTITCQPRDCAVVIEDEFAGYTLQNKKTILGLHPGETLVQVFADDYEHLTRRVTLAEGKPSTEAFVLKRSDSNRQDLAKASILKALSAMGGVEGLVELGHIEGDGTLQWTTSTGSVEQWQMTFTKRPGRDLSATFKAPGGQCTASIVIQSSKQDCRGELKNSGEKIAEQAATLFLSYQLQEVLHTLLKRPMITSESDDNRIESRDPKDFYVLTIGNDGFPTSLVYSVGDKEQPIQVQYSNYLKLTRGWYPGKTSIGRLDAAPAWVFTLKSVQSRTLR